MAQVKRFVIPAPPLIGCVEDHYNKPERYRLAGIYQPADAKIIGIPLNMYFDNEDIVVLVESASYPMAEDARSWPTINTRHGYLELISETPQ